MLLTIVYFDLIAAIFNFIKTYTLCVGGVRLLPRLVLTSNNETLDTRLKFMNTECFKSLASFTTRYVVKTNSLAALDHNDTRTHANFFHQRNVDASRVCVS